MKKGIVMEIDDAFLLLLTPEGEFLHANKQNQSYSIGEEIHFFPVENNQTRSSFISVKNLLRMKPIWAVLAALLIFLGSYIPEYQNNKAYAYMSIDVNPSIELGVNKNMQVVELTGFNQDGKKVISQLHQWKGKDISDLTQTILSEMGKEGYLAANKQVIISTVRTNPTEKNVEDKLNENIKEIKATADKEHLALKVLHGTEKDREKAHQLGISTGKYQENKIQSSSVKENLQTNPPDEQKEKDAEKKNKSAKQALPSEQLKKQNNTKQSQHGEKKEKEIKKSNKKGNHGSNNKSINSTPSKTKKKHELKHGQNWKAQNEWNQWEEWNQKNVWKKLNDLKSRPHLNQWDKINQKSHSKHQNWEN
jgi:hypothetical protein